MINYINKNKTLFFDFFVLLFLLTLLNVFYPVHNNKTRYPVLFNIENGETVSNVAENLKNDNLISFPILFKLSVFFHGGVVRRGNYYLEKEHSVFTLAYHITSTNKKIKKQCFVFIYIIYHLGIFFGAFIFFAVLSFLLNISISVNGK